jgi:hypothetical protein
MDEEEVDRHASVCSHCTRTRTRRSPDDSRCSARLFCCVYRVRALWHTQIDAEVSEDDAELEQRPSQRSSKMKVEKAEPKPAAASASAAAAPPAKKEEEQPAVRGACPAGTVTFAHACLSVTLVLCCV